MALHPFAVPGFQKFDNDLFHLFRGIGLGKEPSYLFAGQDYLVKRGLFLFGHDLFHDITGQLPLLAKAFHTLRL